MYEELVKQMRFCAEDQPVEECQDKCPNFGNFRPFEYCFSKLIAEAADAIEELLKAASAMHAWIFINSGDEQAAYDECGLSDEMNAALGHGGQFEAELPRDIKLKVMKRENELGIYDELPLVDQREPPKEES